MIFPADVYKGTEESNKMVGENRLQLFMILFVFGGIGLFFVLLHVFQTYLHAGLKATILAEFVIMLLIGVTAYRLYVFREDEKKQEYENRNNDSFARYMFLQKDSRKDIETRAQTFHLFEYNNGAITCTLEFKYGSNDSMRAEATRDCLQSIVHTMALYGFDTRFSIMSEDFGDSLDFKSYMNTLNGIEDINLRKCNIAIAEEALRLTDNYSNVEVMYLTISARSTYQLEELRVALLDCFKSIRSAATAFRSVRCLDLQEIIDFYRHYYCIQAIDLSMMRAIALSDVESEFASIVKTVVLFGESGAQYSNMKDIEKQFNTELRKI